MTDNDVLRYFCGAKLKNIQKKKLDNIPEDILNYLTNRYDDSLSIRETIIRIKLGIDKHPLCPICGKPRLLHNYKSIFLDTCGNKECIKKNFNAKFENTMLSRHGYAYNFCNDEILKKSIELAHTPENIKKSIETSIQKYGIGNCRNRKKAKETNLENHGVENYFNINKAKQTKLEKYGIERFVNPLKAKQTKLERYGTENYTNKEKTKKTCIEKYGVENVLLSKEIQNKAHETLVKKYKSAFNLDECKKTWIEKYGVNNPWKADVIKNKIKETNINRFGTSHWSSSVIGKETISKISSDKNIQFRKYETMKKNNSYTKSKTEDKAYELLKEKYHDVIRQYRSKEKYPFNCDFYIPSIDAYIEYQGSQFHHFHPFDNTNIYDIKELEKLKKFSNGINQYSKIIYTWTDLDVRKRKIAKENNLNFFEFFNIDELLNWLKDN